MTWNRRQRFVTVLFALMSLLFMQLAVAAYACPAGSLMQQTGMAENSAMPCAESMTAFVTDNEQPSLCAAHCKADQQSADTNPSPGLTAPAMLSSDYALLRLNLPSLVAPLEAPLLMRNHARSVAVRHCCFRL
ncbi:hypothetical protein [Polaromonas eurypsychrophila]|uniref:Copper resistance protein n=1 Tax=Polaromonas eurypsychrophila TaxID=1614635 RepID=A0A916WGZ0_9BURK|nr:hypothetical protein [Polaromonas eurypsychrophila]GGA96743.1 hypothetical protein GCM10011496_17250 [Polaromonas eurypsychrophila]